MKTAKHTFYCHTNKVSGKKYVGQTMLTMERRWSKHVSDAKRRRGSPLFGAAIRKYGPDAFEHELLEEVVTTQEDADVRESKWISDKKSLASDGYNLSTGGYSGTSEPLKKRMAAMSPEKRSEFFKRTIHRPENWTPERRAKHGAILHSEKSMENRRKAAPRQAEKMRDFQLARQATLTSEQKSEIARNAWKTRRAKYGPNGVKNLKSFEEASTTSHGIWAKIDPERRSEIARERWAKIPAAERSAVALRTWADMTPEQRAERGRKISEGRRRAKEAKEAKASKANGGAVAIDADLVPFVRHWHDRGYSAESIAEAFEISVSEVERLVA